MHNRNDYVVMRTTKRYRRCVMTKEENDQKNRQPDKVREECVIDFAEIYREIEFLYEAEE